MHKKVKQGYGPALVKLLSTTTTIAIYKKKSQHIKPSIKRLHWLLFTSIKYNKKSVFNLISKDKNKYYFLLDLDTSFVVSLYHNNNNNKNLSIMTTTIEFQLPFSKVTNPASYELVSKLRDFDLFSCEESNSQLMKRLDFEEAEQILDLLEKGNQINLK